MCCTGGVLICYRVTSNEELTDLIRFVSHTIANQKSMNIDRVSFVNPAGSKLGSQAELQDLIQLESSAQ